MSAERERLRLTFDADPATYDRLRPVCPPALFDDLVALGGLAPGARLVEVGCGTGQATRPLLERGFVVTAVEIGAHLAAFTRLKLAAFPGLTVVNAAFEAWDPGAACFDAVVVVNAVHWLDPDRRYEVLARVLRDGGALAVVGSQYVMPDDPGAFLAAVQPDYAAVRGGPPGEPPPRPEEVADRGAEIAASGWFDHVATRRYRWQIGRSADDYVALLGTTSWHVRLPDDERRALFDRIRRRVAALPDGIVTLDLLATLDVARRAAPAGA
ncbi:MAG TPA: class I SAM-dependent methyltransferase [Thermomicrobiaceae bacterium]|nr:class I SAM-dependent methyltransferase [Thermomicrobiaceae bacterium]